MIKLLLLMLASLLTVCHNTKHLPVCERNSVLTLM